jgi:PAS domain S-box-containing protein
MIESFAQAVLFFGALSVAAAAIWKVAHPLWSKRKVAGSFFSGFERITEIPIIVEEHGDLKTTVGTLEVKVEELPVIQERHNELESTLGEVGDKLDYVIENMGIMAAAFEKLSADVVEHMKEEEKLREQERDIVKDMTHAIENLAKSMSKQVLEVADIVFRQVVFADPVAYYITGRDEENDGWVWKWGNHSYFKLTGLTEGQASSGQQWDIVDPKNKARFMEAITRAKKRGEPMEIDFDCINMKTGESKPVRVIAWPIHSQDGAVAGYLGAIHVRYNGDDTIEDVRYY